MKRYISKFEEKKFLYIQKLDEGLRLSDLQNHSGISDFTKPFMIDRRTLKGTGSQSATLIDCTVNKQKNFVTFEFRSAPTYPTEDHRKTVPSSDFDLKKTPIYVEEIMILNFFDWLNVFEGEEIKEPEIKEILQVSDIKVFCNCPMYHWQGANYYMSDVFDGSIYPTNIAPEFWNSSKYHGEGNALVCKHLDLIINSIAFFRNLMASMLTKKLRDRNYI